MNKLLKLVLLIVFIGTLTSVTAFARDTITTQGTKTGFQVGQASGIFDETAMSTFTNLTSCIIVAASGGQECPATSGRYCPAEFPVCCMIKGSWRCVAKLSDCHD
jgi:hypothetical protein